MMKKRLFREEQLERITSPERLDRYIRVADPGAWIVLAALLFLAAGVLVWGFTGTISKTIEIQGIVEENGQISCYLPAETEVDGLEGCRTAISRIGEKGVSAFGQVTNVSAYPYSREEAAAFLVGDWLQDRLIRWDYVYQVTITPKEKIDLQAQTMVDLVMVTSEVKPVQFILE